jgi:BioD-like phosphotransacetylase family protein
MALLYIASTETFVGKSAVCVGILDRAQRDGFSVGYMKPVSVAIASAEDIVHDDDAGFIRQHFGFSDPLERIAPIQLTPGVVERLLRGQPTDLRRQLRNAYVTLSRDKDLVVLEGTNHWAEGSLVDLSADQISEDLHAPILLVARYHNAFSIDSILSVQRYVGDRLVGVLLNQVEEAQLEYTRNRVAPFLEQRGIPVLGILEQDPQLAGVTVGELLDYLGGQLIGNPSWRNKLVEHLMIGAMSANAALSHFRRRRNKAVFTGGDRTDMQMAALETSTSVLVLTGNMRPSPAVIDRAEECEVPLILLADDTLTAVERADHVFGHIRFKRMAKIERFTELLDQHFDFARLYDELGMVAL